MSSPYRRRFASLCFVASFAMGARGLGADPRLEKVFADWDKRRERVQVVRYFVAGEETILKGTTHDPNQRISPPLPERDWKGRKKFMLLLDFAKNRHRLEEDHEDLIRNEKTASRAVLKEVRGSLFDGTFLKALNSWGKNTYKFPGAGPRADLAILKGEFGNYSGFNHYTYPLFLGHAIFGNSLYDGENYQPGHLKPRPDMASLIVHGRETYEGRTFVVLRSPVRGNVNSGLGYKQIWVDPEKESAIVRVIEKVDDKVSHDLRIDYQPTAKGWLPKKWIWTHYLCELDGRLESSEELRVDRLLLDPKLSDADFTFTEKPGMLVLENVQTPSYTLTRVHWFRIGADGKRTEVFFSKR